MSAEHPTQAGAPTAAPRGAVPVWAGIVVRDLERSARWYADALGVGVADRGASFAVVRFRDGSTVELVAGDPARPGTAFPSYRNDPGPPVVPGFRVLDPAEAARRLVVARSLPDWIVVVAPHGLRSVLCRADGAPGAGLVGFDVAAPDAESLTSWFAGFGAPVAVTPGEWVRVVPVIAGLADDELTDPDGLTVRTVA